MQNLTDVHNRLQQKRKEKREISQAFKDELRANARYMEIVEEMEKLKAEKKSIENEARARDMDLARLDDLKLDIKTDVELLADIALNMYVERIPVEIVDDFNARWVPVFAVRFKKS